MKSSHAYLGLSAASFSIALVNSKGNSILLLAQYALPFGLSPDALEENYTTLLKEIPFSLDSCLDTEVFLSNEKFSLVPEGFYQKSKEQQLLAYTCTLNEDEKIKNDYWPNSQCLLVYAYAPTLKNWIEQHFPNVSLKHQATAYYNLHQHFKSSAMFLLLYVGPNTAHFYIGEKDQTVFYNHFNFTTEEDLVYFILYTLEQNQMKAAEMKLNLAGFSLKGDKLHSLFSRHFSFVEDLPLPSVLKWSNTMSALDLRQNINLIGAI